MAETRSQTKVPDGDIQLVRYLMKAADRDPAYRDVYLQRAVRDVVTFLADFETDSGRITNCASYIREWIRRERAES